MQLKMNKNFILFLNIIIVDWCQTQEINYYPSNSVLINHYENNIRNNKNQRIENNENSTRFATYQFNRSIVKREIDPVFRGHPKTREELWNEHFLQSNKAFDQNPSLVTLIHKVTWKHLNDCTPVILYDRDIVNQESLLFQNIMKDFPVTFVHGRIGDNNKLENPEILLPVQECLHFIVFLKELSTCSKVIGMQSSSKVVVVARTSQWAVQEFLSGASSRKIVNLLVIRQSLKEDDETIEAPYLLYTHKLYIDGLGASIPIVLTSWSHGKFSREVDLFPQKMARGYAGHRLIVAAANQPPFVFKRIQSDSDGGNPRVVWEGIEIRILELLAQKNNFSIEVIEPQELHLGSGDAVAREVLLGRADIGIAGLYLTADRVQLMDMTFPHSQDCAAFVTLLSTALPRYRAILGPFHWHVWVALTITYLFGIFPLAFSDKHTLRHLLDDFGEVENMFWYVFGTFTNCFTFVGKNSWSRTDKITTRLLIGWYWIFTIIITSCYTGSIIAFVTLPIFPETINSIEQLLKGFFRIGTLDKGGWEKWFLNSSDPKTHKLLKKMEFVPTVQSGIKNTTSAFFWNYAFLGSRAELEYIVQANFSMTAKSKKSSLHISNECFVPFGVAMAFPNQSIYTAKLSSDITRFIQSGLLDKIVDEVRWTMQRSPSGKFLAVSSGSLKMTSAEEKGLTLEDTQGMFLLLLLGFLFGVTALISEWVGGCSKYCRPKKKDTPIPTTTSTENLVTTAKSSIDCEIRILPDGDSIFKFGVKSPSEESSDTLDGTIMDVTEDDIIVHRNFDTIKWDRRSSSADWDQEIQEIFEKDGNRRRIKSGTHIKTKENITFIKPEINSA